MAIRDVTGLPGTAAAAVMERLAIQGLVEPAGTGGRFAKHFRQSSGGGAQIGDPINAGEPTVH